LFLSSYGDKINEIKIEGFINDYNPKTNWTVFAFTKDEDIVMMSIEGFLIVIDPISEVVKSKQDLRHMFKL